MHDILGAANNKGADQPAVLSFVLFESSKICWFCLYIMFYLCLKVAGIAYFKITVNYKMVKSSTKQLEPRHEKTCLGGF